MTWRGSGERHTRQGRARGQTVGTLDRGWDGAGYQDLHDPGSHASAAARQALNRPEPSAHLRTIAALGCWCGEHHGHDWPGKADGKPHPR